VHRECRQWQHSIATGHVWALWLDTASADLAALVLLLQQYVQPAGNQRDSTLATRFRGFSIEGC
jgi:hypothetical protein